MSTLNQNDSKEIGDVVLFRELPAAQLQELIPLLHRKTFASGTAMMTEEQAGEVVYLIQSGTVKVCADSEDGSEVILTILGPGEIVGEMSALDQPMRSASVITLEKTQVLWIDRASFHRALLTMPRMSYNLSCILSARLRMADNQIRSLARLEVENRVARQLISFAERYGQTQSNGDTHIPIRLTQGDIAALIGASREHINKVIVAYKERGYLSVDRQYHITIHNSQALAKRC
ncbi:MAG: Crp/Fnr family transcriptional regulator [Acidobacteriota bacterium]|nr:Crp/Fnr family transcriptional regulator [Acidobacteriota bacterium]